MCIKVNNTPPQPNSRPEADSQPEARQPDRPHSNSALSRLRAASLDHERFKNVLSAYQSAITILALIVGGGWTSFLFYGLHQRQKAEVDLQDSQRKIREQISLEVQLGVKPGHFRIQSTSIFEADVTVQNKGNRDVMLCFDQTNPGPIPLTATRIEFDGEGKLKLSAPIVATSVDSQLMDRRSLVVRTGTISRLLFILTVDQPGLYYIEYQMKAHNFEDDAAREKCSQELNVWRDGVLSELIPTPIASKR
jgi:hypothetical protein